MSASDVEVSKVRHWIEIDGYAGAPSVAAAGKALLFYNQSTGKLMMSKDGGTASEVPMLSTAILASVFANVQGTPTFTIGNEASHARIVTVQLNDINGAAIAFKTLVHVWFSDAAADAVTATGPDGTIAISASSGVIVETVSDKKVYNVMTGATGQFKLTITNSGAVSWYMNVALADGRVFSSAVIAFAG